MRQQGPPVDALSPERLQRLHRSVLDDRNEVRALLSAACRERSVLRNGVDRRSSTRTARIRLVSESRVTLGVENIVVGKQPQVYFNFEIDRVRYFFAATPISEVDGDQLEIQLPDAIYRSERRDLPRGRGGSASQADSVQIVAGGEGAMAVEVVNRSYQGLCLRLRDSQAASLGSTFEIRTAGNERGGRQFGTVRHVSQDPERAGWVRVGLAVSGVPPSSLIPVERRDRILEGGLSTRTWRRVALATEVARGTSARVVKRIGKSSVRGRVEVVEYSNSRGEPIRGIINRTGADVRGAPAVVIAPAWGRTKETLLPLAQTLIGTFQKAGEPLVVLRFDGTHRRGESYVEPELRGEGSEYLNFTFSQAVSDIESSISYLEESPEFSPSETVLVTYSLGAVEGRRALAARRGRGMAGWVSVVGMVDLQTGLRTVSGGVDYAYGLSTGVRFGKHELVGVVADMDRTGLDALGHRLVFADDAKRDMAAIDVPVTWIHGRYDAWMDLGSVRELMSVGQSHGRRLIEIPSGHELRSSREALETFQLVSEEVSGMLLGRSLTPSVPNLVRLERTRSAERKRLPKSDVDLHGFWKDYLLGRDESVGIELMTTTSSYRDLMSMQTERLELEAQSTVADLGSGTGDFPFMLRGAPTAPDDVTVVEVDYVHGALVRGRDRLDGDSQPRALCVQADLGGGGPLPLATGVFDSVLASLLISYLSRPVDLMHEINRILRPGGRLVLSSLRRDADISRIYVEGMAELPVERVRELFGLDVASRFPEIQRAFLNDAARVLSFEEKGLFRFWDADELARLVSRAGFDSIRCEESFGSPPQAIVLSARRA